jgi:large subunit ribosomal protein L7/L12
MADLEKLMGALSELTVLEAAELVKMLEEKWGVSAAAPVAAMAAAPAAAEEEVEEKTEFDVVIKDAGPKKIETIKVIRQLTNLGLVDAKNMAETPIPRCSRLLVKTLRRTPRKNSKLPAPRSNFCKYIRFW